MCYNNRKFLFKEETVMNKRVLTVQDISCVGQCSLTVALPIVSACGIETCVLPSSVLSTHTGGFQGFTFRDLTEDMPKIKDHWVKEAIKFEAVYTGYLGSIKQMDYVEDICKATLKDGGTLFIDPAMADNGKLYYGFDEKFAAAMAKFSGNADYVLPNVTEACFMTGTEYRETYDKAYIDELIRKLLALGAKKVVFTGIGYTDKTTGVVVSDGKTTDYYCHEKLEKGCHGTGDIFASAFVGSIMQGKSDIEAAKKAADYVYECIKYTHEHYPDHWYGACFEPLLYKLKA